MNDSHTRTALYTADRPAVRDRLETPAGTWRDVKRLLVIRAGNVGDMLLAAPALGAIKQSMHGVHLTVLTGAEGAEVARLNDDIDDIIVFSAPWLDAEATFARTAFREEAMIEVIRAGRFDAAIVLPTGERDPMHAAYLCYVAGVPRIQPPWPCAGWTGKSEAACPDTSTPLSLETVTASTHEVERCLDVVGRIGMHTDEARLV